MADRVYVLTDVGRKMGSSFAPSRRDPVLDYIYTNKTVRLSELASYLGLNESRARGRVRDYIKKGQVRELTQ